ncbi:MAG: hypothetical protein A3B37_02290 [Candidatus Sungbacteria bacterium RIFCSPLOWO2_01_FULL_59_16]|uniref:Uncharacterized protein n=1 Tax=Candidatus Sungbacteria bacterium RIFCSPLOWO2_01_FULL_59_16 TaxID=1802280 RepID=A0A1G2LCN8_9BACT|nr:MAG: hypothetical protein A3B37_02290 [Candidatus Sungbacteria bacterium RIFCSPLOWO2_01_FULL_59_16]
MTEAMVGIRVMMEHSCQILFQNIFRARRLILTVRETPIKVTIIGSVTIRVLRFVPELHR